MDEINPAKARATLRLYGLGAILVTLLAASLYGWIARDKGRDVLASAGTTCSSASDVAKRLKPLAKGEVAAFSVTDAPKPLRPLTFLNSKGEPVTLESFKGRAVLVNLWATWCAPCRKEMPALDALQGEMGGAEFEVVAINIDTRNFEKPKAFLDEIAVKRLAYYSDPKAQIFQDLKSVGRAFGMPTTLLIDKNGCELGHLAGPAEWASPDALALVRAALEK